MVELFTSENLIALLTLSVLEIVLGIDNIVFISIVASRLPEAQRPRARLIGLSLALIVRVLLLFAITWVMQLTADLFSLFGVGISGKDLILICGGLFLIAKSTHEIHAKLEHGTEDPSKVRAASFAGAITQIVLVDLVFSFDSVITAVGMVDEIAVMIVAVLIAISVMMIFAGAIGRFVERHPAIKLLALSFLILIGVLLVAEGFDQHIPKGYVYFAMAFSLVVEMLNMKMRKNARPMVGGVTGRPQPGEQDPAL